jgi:hypothetical protein
MYNRMLRYTYKLWDIVLHRNLFIMPLLTIGKQNV